jgi:hypothetical protein
VPDLRALSVRQPWAWAILHAGKLVENREWDGCSYRGPMLLHAGKSCTRAEYSSAVASFQVMRADLGLPPIDVPPLDELARGCLVGITRIVRVDRHPSHGIVDVRGRDGVMRRLDWGRGYCGFRISSGGERAVLGLQLADVRELGRVPWKGELGLFSVGGASLPDVYWRAWNEAATRGGTHAA